MENKLNIQIEDKVTPRLIIVEAKIMALANALCNDEQFAKFNRGVGQYTKELIAELVKQQPHLLQESPELSDLLKS